MTAYYNKLSLNEIASDLIETLCDLVFNAGQYHLDPLREKLEELEISNDARSNAFLVELMEELLKYDRDQLNPEAQKLMKAAAEEIIRLGAYSLSKKS